MLFKLYHILLLLFIFNNVNYISTEPLSLMLGGSVLMGSWLGWDIIKTNTICRYTECCNDQYVTYDLNKLKQLFSQKMFGQPLVNELISILSAHKEGLSNEGNRNKKALVISLHGWSGVGKNYATSMIAESLYKKGIHSKFVKVFMGKKDFDCTDIQNTQMKLIQEVKDIVRNCPTSLIVFDEIHEMCPSVLDAIKPMLDHHQTVDGIDFRDSVFIFISNIGGKEIASNLLELYSQGVNRNEVDFHHFEPIIRRTAYSTGGFEKSATIAQHLIDHYIPFLPLEQNHVEKCALAEFQAHGIYHPTEEMMADALSVITYGPTEDQPIFANNGCKRFTKQIPYIIQKNKAKSEL
ncbi:torsin-like protein [Colias croceus]|uniref:torsin-like protein n=1 Tax=Colias crocea TaxID=72248 RepID=UPI001E27AA22|nr:torsin-like protein [Colias croceus]